MIYFNFWKTKHLYFFFPSVIYQKRLKKEKRTRRRVQEQLEAEVKKRAQYEEALRNNSAETLRLLNGMCNNNKDSIPSDIAS